MKKSFLKSLKYKLPIIKLYIVRENSSRGDSPKIKTIKDASRFFKPLCYLPEEHFVSLHLNAKHEVIGVHEVSHGTLSESLVHPREVFKAAILSNSHAILVCHNHPSGATLTPSNEDIKVTKLLVEAAQFLGINLIDHLIVGPNQAAYSLRENYPHLWCK
jgi:DNA repair protein RadC